ncbi:hypothetical protein [Companilactobacillus furfuricola]|uniref:hypothetical protein n=1 Tax=Companilactobacillus furfuricola TaxID=1462575 RepID=UPI000F7B8ED9|nr:hypothetical protein [Companilactobacillus furfuricola]
MKYRTLIILMDIGSEDSATIAEDRRSLPSEEDRSGRLKQHAYDSPDISNTILVLSSFVVKNFMTDNRMPYTIPQNLGFYKNYSL